jgi:actin-like ATPase involved in cell morphogenesis
MGRPRKQLPLDELLAFLRICGEATAMRIAVRFGMAHGTCYNRLSEHCVRGEILSTDGPRATAVRYRAP